MPKSAVATPEVTMLHPDALVPHPENPRGKLTRSSVEDLLAVIEAQGQKQPCVVRSSEVKGKFQIILGHRRAAVARALRRDVPCIVEVLDDDQALAIMLADNPSHLAPDPMLESRAVAAFLSRPNWTLQAVAEAMGKSPRWVAQRANLQTLDPGVREVLNEESGHPMSKWPVAWLERVAALAPDSQRAFTDKIDRSPPDTISELETDLAEFTHRLGSAPWGLEDAELVPEAGTCEACPKQSGRSPGLFDDGRPPKLLKDALCRDSSCWKAKLRAHQRIRVKELRAEHDDLVALAGEREYYDNEPLKIPGLKIVPLHHYTVAKKGEKGAVPGLVVRGDRKGQLRWVVIEKAWLKEQNREEKEKSAAVEERKAKESPAAVEARQARMRAAQRATVFAKLVAERLEDAPLPQGSVASSNTEQIRVAVALVTAYGGPATLMDQEDRERLLAKAVADGPDSMVEVDTLWHRLREGLVAELSQDWGNDLSQSEVRSIAKLMGFPVEEMLQEALTRAPEPAVVSAASAGSEGA